MEPRLRASRDVDRMPAPQRPHAVGPAGGETEGPQHLWSGSLRGTGQSAEHSPRFRERSPRVATKKQLGKAQVRAMVRIQIQMQQSGVSVSDEWIDALFDRFDVDNNGLMDDAEWDSLVQVLGAELEREARKTPRQPVQRYVSLTDRRLARVMQDAKKPPRRPDRRIHKPGHAATRIQAAWRGYWVRLRLKDRRRHLTECAVTVQSAFRGHRARGEAILLKHFSSTSTTSGRGSLRLPPSFVPAAANSGGFVPEAFREPGYIAVVVPLGSSGGDALQLTSKDGHVIEVEIPTGLVEGDEFEVYVGAEPQTEPVAETEASEAVPKLKLEPEPELEPEPARLDPGTELLKARLAELSARRTATLGNRWRGAAAASAAKGSHTSPTLEASVRALREERKRSPATAALRSSLKQHTEWHRTNAGATHAWMTPARQSSGLASIALRELFNSIRTEDQAMSVFARIDREKSGLLDISEFQRALRLLNCHLSEKQVWLIMNELDASGDEEIAVDDFLAMLRNAKRDTLRRICATVASNVGICELPLLFQYLDKSGQGFLDIDDFRRIVRKEAKIPTASLPEEELQFIFATMQADTSDGQITQEQFVFSLSVDKAQKGVGKQDVSASGEAMVRIVKSAEDKNIKLLYLLTRHASEAAAELTERQLEDALETLGVQLSEHEMNDLVEDLDPSGHGTIPIVEVAKRMREAQRELKKAVVAPSEGTPPPAARENARRVTPRRAKPAGAPVAMGTARAAPLGSTKELTDPSANKAETDTFGLPADVALRKSFEMIFEAIRSNDHALQVFAGQDRDKDGSIDVGEFKKALMLLDVHLSDRQVRMVMKELDRDGDGLLDIDEFLVLVRQGKLERVRSKFRAAAYAAGIQDWCKLFQRYDKDSDGSITFSEFLRAVRRDVKIPITAVSDEYPK